MNIKQEREHCDTCLSFGRRLSELGPLGASDVFTKLLDASSFNYYNSLRCIKICWECRAELQNVYKFQNRVYWAARTLAQTTELDDSYSLSTLKIRHIGEELAIQCSHKDYEQIKLEKEDIVDIKNESYINEDFFDTEPFEVEEKPASVKLKSKKTKHEKKVKLKRKSQNRKYTVLRVDTDYTMRTEVITDVNLYLEKERQSQFFTEKSFKCNKCVVSFMNKKYLIAHEKELHKKFPNSLKCNICECYYADKEALSQHESSHCQKYVCNKCEYECLTKNHMRSHLRTEHHKVYRCNLCQMEFDNRTKIKDHISSWHSRFECAECGTAFKTRGGIERHILHQHSSLHCTICNKTFAQKKYYNIHYRSKHSEVKTEDAYCVECDKHFSNLMSYKTHLYDSARHRKVKKSFPCSDCGKSFSKRAYLNQHYAHAHTNTSKHRCAHCEKSFARREHLTRHVRRVHDGEAPLKDKVCYVCGRAFSQNRILIHHLRTHTGERPFACSRCPASFSQRAALVTHTRAVHKETHI